MIVPRGIQLMHTGVAAGSTPQVLFGLPGVDCWWRLRSIYTVLANGSGAAVFGEVRVIDSGIGIRMRWDWTTAANDTSGPSDLGNLDLLMTPGSSLQVIWAIPVPVGSAGFLIAEAELDG